MMKTMWKGQPENSIHELLEFALLLAHAAEEQILPFFRYADAYIKPDGTEVTLADRMAEKVMRNIISTRYPRHGIIGEEYGALPPSDGRFTWVLDPIDGTSWFTMGTPLFGTLIGLVDRGEPVLGVIHLPILQETVYAATGLGCWFKASSAPAIRTRVAPHVAPVDSVVLASGLHKSNIMDRSDPHAYNLSNILHTSRKVRFYGDGIQHTLVCRGYAHAAIDTIMKPWDIAALVPCVREAGGIISSLEGEQENLIHQQTILSSCSPQLHQEFLALLKPESRKLALAG